MRYGKRVKRERIQAGMTVQQLSEAVGYTTATICKWESGYTNPSCTAQLALERIFPALAACKQETTGEILPKNLTIEIYDEVASKRITVSGDPDLVKEAALLFKSVKERKFKAGRLAKNILIREDGEHPEEKFTDK